MEKFKLGDIVYHKATHKRGVVRELSEEGEIIITTQDDEIKSYKPEELWIEQEWQERSRGNVR